MVEIKLESLTKHFGATVAVDGVSVTIRAGELFFLLGPSGCGKTTVLRMIAGFVLPTAGRVTFDGQDMTYVPPYLRNTGMVFQSYALWPHMTVAQNVAFGLEVRKVGREERRRRVGEALALVRMEALAERKPNQLSGGQQQRVALARAVAVRPRCLLLDEPLSNLDAKLRLEMRSEIRRIVKQTGITAVYVTHDQKEALSMADGIGVLRAGRLEQTGGPEDLYRRPESRFVADFIGESNFLEGVVAGVVEGGAEPAGEFVRVQTAAGIVEGVGRGSGWQAGKAVWAAFRPEAVVLGGGEGTRNAERGTRNDGSKAGGLVGVLRGKRVGVTYLGEMAEHVVEVGGGVRVKAFELNPRRGQEPGQAVTLGVEREDVMVLERGQTV